MLVSFLSSRANLYHYHFNLLYIILKCTNKVPSFIHDPTCSFSRCTSVCNRYIDDNLDNLTIINGLECKYRIQYIFQFSIVAYIKSILPRFLYNWNTYWCIKSIRGLRKLDFFAPYEYDYSHIFCIVRFLDAWTWSPWTWCTKCVYDFFD